MPRGRRCPRFGGHDAAHQGSDGQQHTVIMIQVENETGMQGDTRDPLAPGQPGFRRAGSEES